MTSLLDPPTSAPDVVAVSGNPRPDSRTLLVARTVAGHLADRLRLTDSVTALDLAEISGQVFAAAAPEADRFRAAVLGAEVVVVATPVYKASYTGLLKAFLDRIPTGGLQGVIAVPVVVSASPAHSFVAEHVLRPLLVELGATVPVRALAVTERQLDDLDSLVGAWLDEAEPVLSRLTGRRTTAAGQ